MVYFINHANYQKNNKKNFTQKTLLDFMKLKSSPVHLSAKFSSEQFLQQYWQKRPLLMRQAFPGYQSPLTPDELAGLACEPNIESRLVLERGGNTPWELRHGAFNADDFANLPATHWTLLVQAVDRHVPEIGDLLEYFRFIPNWRIDDVMISYAPDQGSVGPHTDSYDVFLLQAWGKRQWSINCDNFNTEYLEHKELRILKDFHAEQTWVLEPGDMLYLPPGVAHHGVALGDCMTFSIGFLAPSTGELMSHYLDERLHDDDMQMRYSDPELQMQQHSGEIATGDLAKIRKMLMRFATDEASMNNWFGRYISQSNHTFPYLSEENTHLNTEAWLAAFKNEGYLRRNARAVFIQTQTNCHLFIEGQQFSLPLALNFAAPLLTGQWDFSYTELQTHLDNQAFVQLLTELTNAGYFYFYSE